MNQLKSIENISFEEALAELEKIVTKIDGGQESLESAVANFERGVLLKSYCENKLQAARLKIEKITKSTEGNIIVEEVTL